MKNIISTYTFTPASNQILIPELMEIRKLQAIINKTTNTIIYAVGISGLGYSSYSNGTITLSYDTTSMSSTDVLEIILEETVKTEKYKWNFAKVVSGGIDTEFGLVKQTGSGMAINQTAGNLVITTGTTAYSETVIRSNESFAGTGLFQWLLTLSQRIANNNFVIEWTDIIGDGLAMTINSATSVSITKTAHGFTAGDVGKGIWIGMSSVASCLTQRATISSITNVNTFVLTVSGFPASGSGTCSLFGMNYYQVIYSGTTATTLGTGYTTQRKGWQNTLVNATINTTASPGHIGIMETSRGYDASFLDQSPATGTAPQTTLRATSNQNVPDEDTQMFLQIRVFNGSTAPASTTTMTVGFINAEMYNSMRVNISGLQSFGFKNALPAQITNTVPVSGTVAVSSATLAASQVIINRFDIPQTIADIASAAITTTTTTSTITPTYGNGYVVGIPVTVVSGTNPTMDVVVQESPDAGTNWEDVYHFPRITATGNYVSPMLKLNGNRVRYVQTISGTTPSFTRAINRLQTNNTGPTIRQRVDRALVANTLNSTTGSFLVRGCSKIQILVNAGAMTTPPVLTFEGSYDGTNWFNIATGNVTYTPTASIVNAYNIGGTSPILAQFVRVRVSTAGSSATINDICLTAME